MPDLIAALLFVAAADAAAVEIVVSPQECARLTMQGPDYVPGVDVAGRPVAPADLPAGEARGPGVVTFEVQATPREGGTWTTEIPLFPLQIDLATGRITAISGEPVPGLTKADLIRACAAAEQVR